MREGGWINIASQGLFTTDSDLFPTKLFRRGHINCCFTRYLHGFFIDFYHRVKQRSLLNLTNQRHIGRKGGADLAVAGLVDCFRETRSRVAEAKSGWKGYILANSAVSRHFGHFRHSVLHY